MHRPESVLIAGKVLGGPLAQHFWRLHLVGRGEKALCLQRQALALAVVDEGKKPEARGGHLREDVETQWVWALQR